MVQQRDVIETNDGSILRYRCQDTESYPELWLTLQPILQIVWRCGNHERDLAIDDIEVWSEGKRNAGR